MEGKKEGKKEEGRRERRKIARLSGRCKFSSSRKLSCVKLLSHVQLFVTPWSAALQAPLSMEFSRQEY